MVHDELFAQHIEYVPRIVRRRSALERVALAVGVAFVVLAALYLVAFRFANPDSVELSPAIREARRGWLRIVMLLGGVVVFATAAYWQWPRRWRDRDGVPMAVPTKDTLRQLRHRRLPIGARIGAR